MKLKSALGAFLLIILLAISVLSKADTPPANTIPVIGLKANYEDIDTEFFCFLSWNNFDGLSRQFYSAEDILENVVLPGDATGMITLVNPWNITCITNWYSHMFDMALDSAYARPGWNGYVIDATHTCTSDTLISKHYASVMKAMMEDVAQDLEALFNQESHSVWLYYGYDEAPAVQWNRMVNDSSAYDNFMPSLFTQEMDSVYRPGLNHPSDSVWQPTLQQVDPRGVLSWMNWHIKHQDETRDFLYVISTMHTIIDWAGMDNLDKDNNNTPPDSNNQAQAVRALFSMEYRGYISGGPQPDTEPNNPRFIAMDAYPFRHVGTLYQDTASYTPLLGDSLAIWMQHHYEVGMDSTFITAWNIMNADTSKHVSLFFVPQSFGRAGGSGMWRYIENPGKYILDYGSYCHRIPTPEEFRMTCNSGLIRGAKALLPYCLSSYSSTEGTGHDAGLLDENNIPFDAPYEEWVYRDRSKDSLNYISPDLIAPFIYGFDPLYDLPLRPSSVSGSQRNTENFLLWKFAAYGRLWNSVRRTYGDIARVAPELALLNWWEDRQNFADIAYDGTEPSMFRDPQIKVFTDENKSSCYLYYLNTFCRANNNPFEIEVDIADFPEETPFSEYALDHNRRFLIEGDMLSRDIYTFRDTLDAGEARLLQMFDDSLAADIRITDPDLGVILPAKGDTLTDYRSVPGETIDILARFYNMGTQSTDYIFVYLYDETDEVYLDTAKISFDGLSVNSCYTVDRDDTILQWRPSATDIGVHILKVFAESIANEPDTTDNCATLVYVVCPKDYATEILDNPWDMTEVPPPAVPPLWNTNDITEMTDWSVSAYSDSVSGMFEGGITDPTQPNWMVMNTGADSTNWIDTDSCFNFSLAGKASRSLDIEVHWIDSEEDTSYIDTGIDLTSTWQEFGPVDLSNIPGSTWDGNVVKFWLEFIGNDRPSNVRIGWIKLTN